MNKAPPKTSGKKQKGKRTLKKTSSKQLHKDTGNNANQQNIQLMQQNQAAKFQPLNNSQQSLPQNHFQQNQATIVPQQNIQTNYAHRNLKAAVNQQHQSSNQGSQHYPTVTAQQGSYVSQIPTQNLTQLIFQTNVEQGDRLLMGVIKDNNGTRVKEVNVNSAMKCFLNLSYRIVTVSQEKKDFFFENRYLLQLIYPSGYTEDVSEILVGFCYKAFPVLGIQEIVCPHCAHAAGCSCAGCKMENNSVSPIPKYNLNRLEQDSADFKFVDMAITSTKLTDLPIVMSLLKAFRLTTEFQGAFTDFADSRLFFYGCSEKMAMHIVESGFRICDFGNNSQCGNGCYLYPSSSAAALQAAGHSRVYGTHTTAQYIFICEVRKFESRAEAQKFGASINFSTINHYHGRLTFDRSRDLSSPDRIPISCSLKPRVVEALDNLLFTDLIVVRHDEAIRPVYLAKVLTNEYMFEGLGCVSCRN